VKKLLYVLTVAIVTTLLGGCFETGSSAPPPPWANTGAPLFNSPDNGATAGDGRVKLEWVPTAGVDYWLFSATDPSLTAFNWTSLPNAKAVVVAPTPTYMCGLVNEVNGTALTYYFATNGRINGGPGGPSSPTISATPYDASTKAWMPNSPLTTPALTTPDIYGLGYTSLTTCANNTALSATGTFAAVGAGGAIFTSPDAISWTGQSSPIATNLNAVTGYAANQNNATTPGLRWVAVGDGGKAVYSTDGTTWKAATSTQTTKTLRSIVQVGGVFYAAGNNGTIISSGDGNSWSLQTTPTSVAAYNLNGIAHAGFYVAVGDHGTILTGGGGAWGLVTSSPTTTSNLHQAAAISTIHGSIYVAVGDGGTIVTSDSYLHNGKWTALTLSGNPDLIGVAVEPRGVETTTAYTTAPAVDPWLGFISAAQFVAIDVNGNTYTSVNGHDWTATGNNTNITCTFGTTCLNPLISSGFGYITSGNTGATATAF
jgi:hypothetical protein